MIKKKSIFSAQSIALMLIGGIGCYYAFKTPQAIIAGMLIGFVISLIWQ